MIAIQSTEQTYILQKRTEITNELTISDLGNQNTYTMQTINLII